MFWWTHGSLTSSHLNLELSLRTPLHYGRFFFHRVLPHSVSHHTTFYFIHRFLHSNNCNSIVYTLQISFFELFWSIVNFFSQTNLGTEANDLKNITCKIFMSVKIARPIWKFHRSSMRGKNTVKLVSLLYLQRKILNTFVLGPKYMSGYSIWYAG